MEDLKITTQGIKGGSTKTNSVGYVLAYYERNKLALDNFLGVGKDYKQREEPVIIFESEGETVFEGTFADLKDALKQKR